MNDLEASPVFSRWMNCKPLILLVLAAVAAAASVPAFAAYNVTISTAPSAIGTWSGGSPNVWTPGGTGSNVNGSDIQGWLNSGTGVTVDTAGGGTESGDILVKDALSWSSSELTLTAAGNVRINAVMTASGTSTLAMTTGGSGTVKCGFAPGELNGFAGRVDFFLADGVTPRAGTGFLTINGAGYTVINSLGAEGSTTGTDLQGISGALAGKHALGANIDATATATWNWDGGTASYLGFLPLGNGTAFTGAFDGLGHTISGLTINRPPASWVGLFGMTTAAKLGNVGLLSVHVSGTTGVGGLAGGSTSTISNAYVDNPAYADGTIQGTVVGVGGLVGQADGSISDVYCRTWIGMPSAANVGGLVGSTSSSCTISNAYYVGTLQKNNGTQNIGGLVGYNAGAISNAYASNAGVIHLGATYVGGLVGVNSGTIMNAYVGGGGPLLTDPGSNIGGLVGGNSGTIGNAYAAGGVVNTGHPGTNVGGLVGSNSGTVTNSFWDTQTTGQATSAAGTGKTTAQMMQLATFIAPATTPSWDMDDAGGTGKVWRIYDTHSYPLLRHFLAPLAVTANDASKTYDGIPYSGGNGVAYLPATYDASKLFGTIAYGGSSQGATAVGAYAITPGGLWSNQPGYDIKDISGTLTISAAAAVGRVPDGASGTPFRVSKSGSQLDLAWGASCGAAATDFAVYEGTLGTWYSHSSLVCSTSGALSATVTPSSGDRYYLIAPLSASKEGSYGTRTGGTEIPQGSSPCKASQDLSACP